MSDPIIDDTQEPFSSVVRPCCTAAPAGVVYSLASVQRAEQAVELLRRIVHADHLERGAEVARAERWLLQFGDVMGS